MRTINKIITNVDCKYGAPIGRSNVGNKPVSNKIKIFDCAIPMYGDGAYDKGGVYWGCGPQLRVKYTKDLSYIEFYRVN